MQIIVKYRKETTLHILMHSKNGDWLYLLDINLMVKVLNSTAIRWENY